MMSHSVTLTADSFFGKAMTIEGLARWARSRIEQAKNNWRAICILHALTILLWWTLLRPFRKSGVECVEPTALGGISAALSEIDAALDQLLRTGHVSGHDSRFLFRGSFRTLKSYHGELKEFAAMVNQASTEWDKIVSEHGAETVNRLKAAALDQESTFPQDPLQTEPVDSSLEPSQLREHVGRIVLRS